MALNPLLIDAQPDTLSDTTKALYKVLFKSNDVYKTNAGIYVVDVDSKLTAAVGTIKAKMLNALMVQIQKLGVGEVEIRADKDGLYYSQTRERDSLVSEAFYVLFDDLSGGGGPGSGVIPDSGLYGVAAIGQRDCVQSSPCNCNCTPCHCQNRLNVFGQCY